MKRVPKFKKINVGECPVIREEPEGVREKEWRIVRKKEALVLYNKLRIDNDAKDYPSESIEDLVEKIGCEICKLLDINCAQVHLGVADGKNCCVSFNFLKKDEVMLDGCTILSEYNDFFNKYRDNGDEECEFFFTQVFDTFKKRDNENFSNMKNDFLKMVLFDCLVGNGDRCNENWGIVLNKNTGRYRMAPVFDNGYLFHKELGASGYCEYNIEYFDALLDYITYNYFKETKDLASKIDNKITNEKLEELFDRIYDGRELKKDKKIDFIMKKKDLIMKKYKIMEKLHTDNEFEMDDFDGMENTWNIEDRIIGRYGKARDYETYDF